jgi:hypothetical protein
VEVVVAGEDVVVVVVGNSVPRHFIECFYALTGILRFKSIPMYQYPDCRISGQFDVTPKRNEKFHCIHYSYNRLHSTNESEALLVFDSVISGDVSLSCSRTK